MLPGSSQQGIPVHFYILLQLSEAPVFLLHLFLSLPSLLPFSHNGLHK